MPDEASLQAVEHALFAALRGRDRAGLDGLLAPEFVLVAERGARIGRAEFLEAALKIPGEILSLDAEYLDVRLYGEIGVLSGVQRARVRLEDGTEVEDRQVFTDVCVWRGGRWWVTFAHSVPAPPSSETGQG